MNKEQIKLFLQEFPGYVKEGKTRLQTLLANRGYSTSLSDCAEAIREVRYTEDKERYDPYQSDNKLKVLIYDIETSYNIVKSWRVGYNLNINPSDIVKERAIICISYKWHNEEDTYNIQWDKNQCDRKLLQEFIPILNEADVIVAHNGDRYDIKFIKTRAIKHGLPMLVNYPQFDTLKVAKKKFSFNSNKLDYISEFLGFGNKLKTEMKLWDDIIFNKSEQAMDKMIEYCNEDVRLLEKVYDKLIQWEYPKIHVGALTSEDNLTSPYTGKKNLELVKTSSTAKGSIKKIMRCKDTGQLFELSKTAYQRYLNEKEEIKESLSKTMNI